MIRYHLFLRTHPLFRAQLGSLGSFGQGSQNLVTVSLQSTAPSLLSSGSDPSSTSPSSPSTPSPQLCFFLRSFSSSSSSSSISSRRRMTPLFLQRSERYKKSQQRERKGDELFTEEGEEQAFPPDGKKGKVEEFFIPDTLKRRPGWSKEDEERLFSASEESLDGIDDVKFSVGKGEDFELLNEKSGYPSLLSFFLHLCSSFFSSHPLLLSFHLLSTSLPLLPLFFFFFTSPFFHHVIFSSSPTSICEFFPLPILFFSCSFSSSSLPSSLFPLPSSLFFPSHILLLPDVFNHMRNQLQSGVQQTASKVIRDMEEEEVEVEGQFDDQHLPPSLKRLQLTRTLREDLHLPRNNSNLLKMRIEEDRALEDVNAKFEMQPGIPLLLLLSTSSLTMLSFSSQVCHPY
jgi:hypothetical protein